jgi:hypothetical protein
MPHAAQCHYRVDSIHIIRVGYFELQFQLPNITHIVELFPGAIVFRARIGVITIIRSVLIRCITF